MSRDDTISLIPFSYPSHEQSEINYMREVFQGHHRHGAGKFTALAVAKLKSLTGINKIIIFSVILIL